MNIDQLTFHSRFSKKLILCTLPFVICGTIWGLSVVLPPAVDWEKAFRPATLNLISGRSPYEIEGFLNPFWALIPLIPIAVFPEQISRAILLVMTIFSFAFTAHKLGAKPLAVLLILLSPPAIQGYLNGNIDALVGLGLVFPPWIGLFFVSIKPQIGIAIALFWVFEAWQDGKWSSVFRLIVPFGSVFFLSILLFGLWPLHSSDNMSLWWNASLWPTSIPVGLALLTAAIRKRKISFAMGASPCLSPYLSFHSWIIALFAIVNSLPELIAAFIGLWILVIIRAIG